MPQQLAGDFKRNSEREAGRGKGVPRQMAMDVLRKAEFQHAGPQMPVEITVFGHFQETAVLLRPGRYQETGRLFRQRDVNDLPGLVHLFPNSTVLDFIRHERFQIGIAETGKAGKEERQHGVLLRLG